MKRIRPWLTASACAAMLALGACYPRFDWRDVRPDCSRGWCGFVATFPGRITTATREVPVGDRRLPLSLHVVSVGAITFAVGAFELPSGSDAAAARAVFEHKLLDDVGASQRTAGTVTMRGTDREDIAATSFEAHGMRDGKTLQAFARFAERRGHLVEVLVIGPAEELSRPTGREAVDTFLSSIRLD